MTYTAAPRRWLFGPASDLLLGAGLLYLVPFALLTFAGDALRSAAPLGVMPLLALFVSVPHYGATLLRVYERRDDRRTYTLFSVWASVLLVLWFAAGLRLPVLGSALVTVYFTWSPWHYAAQNYGVAALFLRREGVELRPAQRQVLRAAFLSSFALSFLALHGATPVATYAPGGLEQGALGFRPLGIPSGTLDLGMAVAGAAWALLTTMSLVLLVQVAGVRRALPAMALLLVQSLWFAVPVLARHHALFGSIEPFSTRDTVYSFLWIGFAHGAQYLWITAYFARRTGRARGNTGFLLRAIAFGALAWTLPALLFAPGALGVTPYDAGLATMVAALVNVHHFVLDGAIWKLRDGPVARVLLRDAPPSTAAATKGGVLARRSALALGAGAAVIALAAGADTHFGLDAGLHTRDLPRALAAADRLALLGRASAENRFQLGLLAKDEGDIETARAQFRRSIDVAPTARAWTALGDLDAVDERFGKALAAYAEALGLDADDPFALFSMARVCAATHEPERAVELLDRAARSAAQRKDTPPALIAAVEELRSLLTRGQ